MNFTNSFKITFLGVILWIFIRVVTLDKYLKNNKSRVIQELLH